MVNLAPSSGRQAGSYLIICGTEKSSRRVCRHVSGCSSHEQVQRRTFSQSLGGAARDISFAPDSGPSGSKILGFIRAQEGHRNDHSKEVFLHLDSGITDGR